MTVLFLWWEYLYLERSSLCWSWALVSTFQSSMVLQTDAKYRSDTWAIMCIFNWTAQLIWFITQENGLVRKIKNTFQNLQTSFTQHNETKNEKTLQKYTCLNSAKVANVIVETLIPPNFVRIDAQWQKLSKLHLGPVCALSAKCDWTHM